MDIIQNIPTHLLGVVRHLAELEERVGHVMYGKNQGANAGVVETVSELKRVSKLVSWYYVCKMPYFHERPISARVEMWWIRFCDRKHQKFN